MDVATQMDADLDATNSVSKSNSTKSLPHRPRHRQLKFLSLYFPLFIL